MTTSSKRIIWIFFLILIILMVAAYFFGGLRSPFLPKPKTLSQVPLESTEGNFYTIKDSSGLTIMQTGITVHVDDRFINEKNIQYVVVRVDGNTAIAEVETKRTSAPQKRTSFWGALAPKQSVGVQAGKNSHVVVYHTHSDESFLPTSGTASKPGNGDIYRVGDAFSNTLLSAGISVTHSRNAHDPHDINAYHRSRRTSVSLLKEQPDAAFDLHRDSAPPAAYWTTINGLDTARTMIVIGQSNPNQNTNLEYARAIKAQADALYPGLMRGIFMGRGSYNQDLYPTAILFEIGTEQLPLSMSENAARCLGDVLTRVIGAPR